MTHAQLKIDNLKEIELNTNINSEFFEKNGYFTKNGNFFFFNRVGDPNNIGNVKDLGDVWYSKKIFEHLWTSPKNLTEVNDINYNLLLGVDDSDNIYIFTDGVLKIYNFSNDGNVRILSTSIISYYNSKSSLISGSISSDQNLILLSLESFGKNELFKDSKK